MFLAMDRDEGNLLFQLINKLYGQSSVIVTPNKGPEDWAELLSDPAIATATLDWLIHRCEIISFNDDSYRVANRETIFGRS